MCIELPPCRESNEAAAAFRARLREREAAEEEELRLRWVAQMEERERLEQMGDEKRRRKKLVRDHLEIGSKAKFHPPKMLMTSCYLLQNIPKSYPLK